MDAPELYARICSVTTRFDFTTPVEDEDVALFSAALREVVPEDHWIDVKPDGAFVRVRVGIGERVRYERLMIVQAP